MKRKSLPKKKASEIKRIARRSGISATELKMIRVQFPTFWRELKRAA